ncbi:tRNA pseudouridine(55) synthase [Malassezia cuniculi]|uniref:tRNA pseudouridine(55) synthase n=1 Tax=Malassezia cuniculi TaxID=948313 RepID=A0AAF0EY91_9BASI|nr:tRNA pseudouridine(55) synthase [Malassezia cuniculi]
MAPPPRAASTSARPLSGLFAIAKPSGPTSMHILDTLKPLFASSSLFYEPGAPEAGGKEQGKKSRRVKPWEKALLQRCGGRMPPKIGQGGTLDPLAEGVLVIGVGAGTKHLQQFLNCTKEYRTVGLLGTATTSYDSQEPVMRKAPHAHVTRELVCSTLPQFTGELMQVPPLYSAVRVDGKRLFDYARQDIPLPRPIEARKVTVSELRLVDWLPGGTHEYKPPTAEISAEDHALVDKIRNMAGSSYDTRRVDMDTAGTSDAPAADTPNKEKPPAADDGPSDPNETDVGHSDDSPPAMVLEMTVSGGTYVRSVVHDLGAAVGSAAHVVRLIRTRQGQFSLGHASAPQDGAVAVADGQVDIPGNCIPWSVFERGLAEQDASKRGDTSLDTRDGSGLREWERVLLGAIQPV